MNKKRLKQRVEALQFDNEMRVGEIMNLEEQVETLNNAVETAVIFSIAALVVCGFVYFTARNLKGTV